MFGGGFYNHDFLYNRGTATLTDTIVAGNTGERGVSSDIDGNESGRVTGSFNLIGTGGAGGIQGGMQGNQLLTSLSRVGLAPLGDFGGPSPTIALLPGSPALGAGISISGIVTDQRGEPRNVAVDIGAFQSQGFFLSASRESTPQFAATGEAFAHALVVTVAARNPVEPVAGGVVAFTVTPNDGGAGADLSAISAVIGDDGRAQVSATANATAGTYTVTASTAGGLTHTCRPHHQLHEDDADGGCHWFGRHDQRHGRLGGLWTNGHVPRHRPGRRHAQRFDHVFRWDRRAGYFSARWFGTSDVD